MFLYTSTQLIPLHLKPKLPKKYMLQMAKMHFLNIKGIDTIITGPMSYRMGVKFQWGQTEPYGCFNPSADYAMALAPVI